MNQSPHSSTGAPYGAATARAKVLVRRRLITARGALSSEYRREASAAIVTHLQETLAWQSAKTIALYLATPEEVDLGAIQNIEQDKRLVFPRVIGPGQMVFHTLGHGVEQGPGQTVQPRGDTAVVTPQAIDMVVLPLLGCDRSGVRLGYGGGYYDRMLPQMRAVRVGIGFSLQLLEGQLPYEEHDQRLDWFVSEHGVERFSVEKPN